jgi:hypothetical protein
LGRWGARRGRWWWIAALILVPVVAGSSLSVALLLLLVDATTVGDQIELIKTGLAVGAGTGGAVALVLAGRRQWSTEQTYRLTERSVDDARHDATERRITDLYSKAADQLGSEQAAVRLAGLYSLERLAQNNPTLRQTIVNLLCAYLRIPFDAPQWPADQRQTETDGTDDRVRELAVRRTAQHILATHVEPGEHPDQPSATFWPGMNLDLEGAVLYLFDLKNAWVRHCTFGGARFVGWARFDGCRFDGPAIFGGVRFDRSVSFRSACFRAEARFRGAHFSGAARFDGAVFDGEALFGGIRRLDTGDVRDGAVFEGEVTFTGAAFAQPPVLDHVQGSVELD